MVQINFAKREINAKLSVFGVSDADQRTCLDQLVALGVYEITEPLHEVDLDGTPCLQARARAGKTGGMNLFLDMHIVPDGLSSEQRQELLAGGDLALFVVDPQAARLEAQQMLLDDLNLASGDMLQYWPLLLLVNQRDGAPGEQLSPEELLEALSRWNNPAFTADLASGLGLDLAFDYLKQWYSRKNDTCMCGTGLVDRGFRRKELHPGLPPPIDDPHGGKGHGHKPQPKPEPKPEPESEPTPEPKPEPSVKPEHWRAPRSGGVVGVRPETTSWWGRLLEALGLR